MKVILQLFSGLSKGQDIKRDHHIMKKLLMMAICLMVLVGTALSSGLSVYPPVPGLDPSPHYQFRVRQVGTEEWKQPFAWFTKCPESNPANDASMYYSQYIGGWSQTYCNFEMGEGVLVEVEITRLDPSTGKPLDITKATPHPRRKVRSWRVENGRAYVVIDNPALFAVDIDGQMDEIIGPRALIPGVPGQAFPFRNENAIHTVTVFANPFITDKPDPNDPSVYLVEPGERAPETGDWTTLYFKPGVHRLFEGDRMDAFQDGHDLQLQSNKQYYIPGDAIVYGHMNTFDRANNWQWTRNVRVFGHGTLSGAKSSHPYDMEDPAESPMTDEAKRLRLLELLGATGSTVEGITLANSSNHTMKMNTRGHADLEEKPANYARWLKTINWRVNSDGITILGNGYLEDSFIRAQDDGTYVRGLGIRNVVYWNDVNAAALRLSFIMNDRHDDFPESLPQTLYVEDIDIIYGRGVFHINDSRYAVIQMPGFNQSGSNTGSHVVFRNINYEDPMPQRALFGFDPHAYGFTPSGSPSGIRFENIRAAAPTVFGNRNTFWGDAGHEISNLIFDNVVIAGRQVTSMDEFDHNVHAFDFIFENTEPQPRTYLNTSGYGKWYIYSDWAEDVEPADHDIVNHTSVSDTLIVDGPAYAGTLNVSHEEGAVIRIENRGSLAVTDKVSLGSAGGVGQIRLIDGTLEIRNSESSALSFNNADIHLEKGTLRWAGNQIGRIQEHYDSGAFTLGQGQPDGHSDTAILIAREEYSTLYAEFDESSGYTTVWLTESDQYPYGGTNHTIPGFIEAEHYDEGGQGVAYFDTTEKQGDLSFRPDDDVDVVAREDASNGYVVSYTSEGEWLEYTVDVEAGNYDITLYYYCGETPGDLLVRLNSDLIETISGMQNQGWDKLDSITVENVFIPTNAIGRILRLEFANGAGFDIDAIRFKKQHTPVSGVTLEDCPGDDLIIGNTLQLTATTVPYYADDKTVSWESSDDSVATVDSTGMVTAVSVGTATITVTTRDGGFTDACEITTDIERISVYGLTISGCPVGLLQTGDTHQLTANVAPEDATDKGVTWSSSNTQVATVDENGLVTAISQGSVAITATTHDGGFTRTCSMGIRSSGISVTGVTLSGCPEGALEADSTYQLMAHVAPANAGDLRVSWSSSDETVATVDEEGWITALSAGEASIIATTHDGDFTAECSVTVDGSTTVRQIDGAGQFVELFPNPASDVIHLRFSESASEKAISIFNTKGQLLFSKKTYSSKTQIDIREFHSEGMLIVKVISGGITASFKIIKE